MYGLEGTHKKSINQFIFLLQNNIYIFGGCNIFGGTFLLSPHKSFSY